jgi:cadmium resistance protein CadD (predicted permease)
MIISYTPVIYFYLNPDLHHITEILSKVALKTITLTLKGAENIGAYVKYFRTLFIIKKIIK